MKPHYAVAVLGLSMLAAMALANNGAPLSDPDSRPVVWLPPPVGCTGTLVRPGGLVLTAAHCVLRVERLRAEGNDPPAKDAFTRLLVADRLGFYRRYETPHPLIVRIEGRDITVTAIPAIHPAYLTFWQAAEEGLASDNHHDLAVLTLPPLPDAPVPAALAEEDLTVGADVTVAGWGQRYLPNEPVTEPLDRQPRLRGGPNTIVRVASGLLTLRRPFGITADATAVTPAAGDSGGPLFDEEGRVIGVAKGGRTRALGGTMVHEAYYVDLKDRENADFLAGIIGRAERDGSPASGAW